MNAQDLGVEESVLAIPPLLAVGAVHHYLIQQGLRTQAGLSEPCGHLRPEFPFGGIPTPSTMELGKAYW